MAGHERLELRNVVAKYPFEKSRRFASISRILAPETIRVRAATDDMPFIDALYANDL